MNALLVKLDFNKIQSICDKNIKVIPVVVQDATSNMVLIVGYVNKLALEKTITEKKLFLWSTSRNELWEKGATSGNTMKVVDVLINCEENSVLVKAELEGEGEGEGEKGGGRGACHTKDEEGNFRISCFYRSLLDETI